MPLGETSQNVNNDDINKKESLLDTINKSKSTNEEDKNPTELYNDQNLFEK